MLKNLFFDPNDPDFDQDYYLEALHERLLEETNWEDASGASGAYIEYYVPEDKGRHHVRYEGMLDKGLYLDLTSDFWLVLEVPKTEVANLSMITRSAAQKITECVDDNYGYVNGYESLDGGAYYESLRSIPEGTIIERVDVSLMNEGTEMYYAPDIYDEKIVETLKSDVISAIEDNLNLANDCAKSVNDMIGVVVT